MAQLMVKIPMPELLLETENQKRRLSNENRIK